MGFNFDKFALLGKKIGEDGSPKPEEEHYRISISRGYYSFYHKVKIHFGFTENERPNHTELAFKLKDDDSIKNGARLSNLMLTMIDERTDADYRPVPRKGRVFNKAFYDRFWGTYNYCVKELNNKK